MPVLLEKRGAGGVRKWPSAGTVAGGLGGNARFTKVSRGVSPPSFTTTKGSFSLGAACNLAAILVRYVVFSVGVLYP